MYRPPSTSSTLAPEPRERNSGCPPTARKARTGELTPPGKSARASSKRAAEREWVMRERAGRVAQHRPHSIPNRCSRGCPHPGTTLPPGGVRRSEEHTSELQSHVNLVCRLLLEKKNSGTASSTRRFVAAASAVTTPILSRLTVRAG